jgi:hypothetical protein
MIAQCTNARAAGAERRGGIDAGRARANPRGAPLRNRAAVRDVSEFAYNRSGRTPASPSVDPRETCAHRHIRSRPMGFAGHAAAIARPAGRVGRPTLALDAAGEHGVERIERIVRAARKLKRLRERADALQGALDRLRGVRVRARNPSAGR